MSPRNNPDVHIGKDALIMEKFEVLLDQFEPMIHACMRKLRIYKNHEVFIQVGRIGLWRAWLRYDSATGHFAPFAYRSIYGSLLDELKKASRDESLIPAEDQTIEILSNKHISRQPEWSGKTLEALSLLNPQERHLIHLLFIECYSLDETADILEITKVNVKKRRERTLKKLKHILSN
jgi:RNA polymerase sigma factor (sigma-70 family)